LIRVVKIAKKIGYRYINLTSSGRKYKDIDFLESILVSGVDSILVSLHGTSEKIHDEITRKT
jgi:MoaA/NifB/PqqE/SkfB family radical SAM enzyme